MPAMIVGDVFALTKRLTTESILSKFFELIGMIVMNWKRKP